MRPAPGKLLALCWLLLLTRAFAAHAATLPLRWNAEWIAAPDGPARDYDVVYFRKTISLPALPAQLLVDVSADTRFELHVNGKRVSAGPALADVHHWRYEVCDLAPYLHAGDNEVAAVVWNFGTAAPVAQMSTQTAFLLSAEDPQNSMFDTGASWQVSHERGRTLSPLAMRDYYAAGPSEVMNGVNMNWSWDDTTASQANQWLAAKPIGHAAMRGAQDSSTHWILEKDELPPMQYRAVEAGQLVRVTSTPEAEQPAAGPLDKPFTVSAHADVTLLFDRRELTTAVPSIQVSGGQNALIDVTYAEALYDAQGAKGNRNEVAGRHIEGLADHILADGATRTYSPLWWRTWRYLQLEVKTADQPLTIEGVKAFYTAYPFSAAAKFDSSDPELSRIWDTGWRTAQLCAHETYMDTPYWEQMQYVGDTRIQALISYAVTGDDRLARQALRAYRDSLLTEGLTQSRYPSSLTQVIPPFSLLWVGMLHDYSLYRDDPAFVASLLPGTRGVLDWFAQRQRADGLLGKIEWWPFVDWSPPFFSGGVPPQEVDGGSSSLTLQFIEALNDAAELETSLGEKDRAASYRERAARASAALMRLNWNEQAGLLADTPARKTYSQQANALAVWLDVIPKDKQRPVMSRVLAVSPGSASPSSESVRMAPASYYFRFYLGKAMVHAGLGDQYIPQLEPWRAMLKLGLSTWAETPEPTRSDSHAWSAHPTLDLLTIVAGITPGSPGFYTVRITPHLGELQSASASMPTPKGLVLVKYTRQGSAWKANITLPGELSGAIDWKEKHLPLLAGSQEVVLQ